MTNNPPNNCHLCQRKLKRHPLYQDARFCTIHGDFYIVDDAGVPRVIFRGFMNCRPQAKRPPNGGSQRIAVKCVQTGRIFPSLYSAAKELGVARSTISKHLDREDADVNGFSLVSLSNRKRPVGVGVKRTKVICVETDRLFPSVRLASKRMKLQRVAIHRHLENPIKYPNVEGYHFIKA